MCYSALSHNLSLSLQPDYHRDSAFFPEAAPFIHLPIISPSVGMQWEIQKCLSALGEIMHQHMNISLSGVPILFNQQRQERAKQESLWCIKSNLRPREHLPAYAYTMRWKSLNIPEFLQCSLVPLSTLAVTWYLEIRAAEIKMFITNL